MAGTPKHSGKRRAVAPRKPFVGRRRVVSPPGTVVDQTASAEPGSAPQPTDPEALIIVGRVSKAIGLDGWLRVLTLSDNPGRFEAGSVVHLKTESGETKPLQILRVRDSGRDNAVGVMFEGFASREGAAELVGKDLFVHAKDRLPLEDDRFYSDEVVGMTVLSPEGEPVGTVLSLESEVPSPYLVVRSPTYGEVLIPFRKVYISSIDRNLRQVRLGEPLQTHVPG